MAKQAPAPLTDADYKKINDTLRLLNTVRSDLALAKAAKLDIGNREEVCDDHCQRLQALKAAYFPDRS